MCLNLLAAAAMALSPLPPLDEFQRRPTALGYGMADERMQVISRQYLAWGRRFARSHGKRDFHRAKGMSNLRILEIGGGWGDKILRALRADVNCLWVDLSKDQVDYVEDRAQGLRGDLRCRTGSFPSDPAVLNFLDGFQIAGVQANSLFHFYSGETNERSFQELWDRLPEVIGYTLKRRLPIYPRVFMVVGTPWNGLLSDFPEEYNEERNRYFGADLSRVTPMELLSTFGRYTIQKRYPYFGEMRNPEKYLQRFYFKRKYFHALEPTSVLLAANAHPEKQWRLVKAYMIQRPLPPEQSFAQGYPDYTEIAGVILERVPRR